LMAGVFMKSISQIKLRGCARPVVIFSDQPELP
jgi:hypothetical protein